MALNIRKKTILLSVFSMLALSAPAGAVNINVPEKLEFQLTWMGVTAGTATMETKRVDADTVQIYTKTVSSDFITRFYPVEDIAEVIIDGAANPLPSLYHLKTREGSKYKDREVLFNRKVNKAFYYDRLSGEKKSYFVPAETLDPLTSFFFVRFLPLEVGKTVYVNMFDSKRVWNVDVQVLKKEKIKTALGEFNTILIKPNMQSEGIFSRIGDMYIWLTDDARRIPVRLDSEVTIGSIKAELKSFTR